MLMQERARENQIINVSTLLQVCHVCLATCARERRRVRMHVPCHLSESHSPVHIEREREFCFCSPRPREKMALDLNARADRPELNCGGSSSISTGRRFPGQTKVRPRSACLLATIITGSISCPILPYPCMQDLSLLMFRDSDSHR